MNFFKWLANRTKKSLAGSQYEWVEGYRHCILEEKFLSILLTLLGGCLYVIFVGWLLIPFIDRADTFTNTIWGLAGSVAMFYVYHWIMALHEVYEKEKQKTWEALKR